MGQRERERERDKDGGGEVERLKSMVQHGKGESEGEMDQTHPCHTPECTHV